MNVQERISELRKLMKERNIDIYYIPNEDDHLSEEYTADHFKCKSYMSGFSGDAGCTIITPDFAGLWTDGRYFTAAEEELQGTGVKLMRLRQEGVPDPIPFVIENVPENGIVGFDGSVVSADTSLLLNRKLNEKHAKMHISEDLVGMVWKDRPVMPEEPLFLMPEQYTGTTASQRIAMVREEMKKKGADALVLTQLEDPCWMLNVRGNDIPCTPVPYAFALVTEQDVFYYIDNEKVTDEVRKYLEDNHVTVRPYDGMQEDLSALHGKLIWADLRSMNTRLYSSISSDNQILNEVSPIMRFRSVKNDTEIRCMYDSQVRDGVAMVKFIMWVKKTVKDGNLDELKAAEYLDSLRAQQDHFIEPSFETISAYQANAAMMHYTAMKEKYSHVDPKGFLLVDSGGTYYDGSTDITRTIACGPLTEEEKRDYTLVLKGHLDLMAAEFLEGTMGNNLDILARRPLWDLHIDYQCGTGHGVGYALSVHEGIHGIRWGVPSAARPSVPFEAGMIVTDEPGIYLPHKLGIRIENDLLVVKDEKNFYGQWLKFEPMTLCPYEREAIDTQYLEKNEIEQINAYHAMVWEKLSPYLNEEEKEWLKQQTEPLEA